MALDLLIGWHFSRVAEHVVLADPFDREVFAPFARRAPSQRAALDVARRLGVVDLHRSRLGRSGR